MNFDLCVSAQAWCAEFLLEINLKILLRKAGARLNFKIALKSLHIDPGFKCRAKRSIFKINPAPVFRSKILRSISSKNSAYQARTLVLPDLKLDTLQLEYLFQVPAFWPLDVLLMSIHVQFWNKIYSKLVSFASEQKSVHLL